MAARRHRKRKPTAFILDGSIALAWFFEDESDAYAVAVQDSLTSAVAVVPALWPLEIANAVLVGERRKRTTETKVSHFIRLLSALPITVTDEEADWAWSDVLPLARAHDLSAYDAAYLELALRQNLPLATLDKPLRSALRAAGGTLYLT